VTRDPIQDGKNCYASRIRQCDVKMLRYLEAISDY
jgi:hypothetical protein